MDKSWVFDSIVNHISAGRVTRDSLAKSIISQTLSLGQQHVCANQMLGKRSAEIVNQVRSVLFDNTQQQVKDGVAPLIEVILKSKGQGEFAQKMAAGFANVLGPSLLQNNALERVLVALKEQPGGENALKLALENAVSGFNCRKLISATFMSVLKRAILDNPEYKPTSFLHHVIAWKIHQSLTQDPTTLPPPPLGLQSIDAIAGKIPGLVTAVCRQLDNLQKFLQLPLSEKELSSVYTECWPSDLMVSNTTSSKDFIKLVLMAHATDQHHILEASIASLPQDAGIAFRRQHIELTEFLTQIPAAEIKLTQNWSGDIEAISTNHHKEHPPSSRLEEFMATRFRASVHHPQMADAYFADEAFIEIFKSGIDLSIDHTPQGYGRWLGDFGAQFLPQAKQLWGGQSEFTAAQLRQLGQLSEMVDNNPLSLLALTRYLIPTSIINAVQDEVFNSFLRLNSVVPPQAAFASAPVIVGTDNVWMTLGEPAVSFTVNKNKTVNLAIAITWPVAEFNTRQPEVNHSLKQEITAKASATGEATINPHGLMAAHQKAGQIATVVNINMLLNPQGLERQSMNIGNTTISLRDRLTFMPAPLTAADRPSGLSAKQMAGENVDNGINKLLLQGASKLTSSC